MRRRTFVAGISAPMLLAGCTMVNGSGNVESARATLTSATGEVGLEAEKFDQVEGEPIDIHTDEIFDLLEDAESQLELAAEAPLQSRADEISRYRDVSTWIRGGTNGLRAAEDANDRWFDVIWHLERRQYEEGFEQLESAESALKTAEQRIMDAEEHRQRTGRNWSEFDEDVLIPLIHWLDAMGFLIDGYWELTRGLARWDQAARAYETNDWEAAIDGLAESRDYFEEAVRHFRNGRDEVDMTLVRHFIDMACATAGFADGAELWRESAVAAASGEWELAQEKAAEGQSAVARC